MISRFSLVFGNYAWTVKGADDVGEVGGEWYGADGQWHDVSRR
jgi:hypothetical protein